MPNISNENVKAKNERLSDLMPLVSAIGYQFNDVSLLTTSLTHRSAFDKHAALVHGPHNERMEFLGDAVLSVVTAHYLYSHNNFMSEGDLSRLRAQFVCQENLSQASKALGLANFIQSDKAMRASGSNNSKAVLADALEALIGAVFIDGGLEAAKAVIFRVLGFPSTKLGALEKDAKTKLQEVVQASLHCAPKYVVMESCGPAHSPKFLVGVKINDELVASASGASKRIAAQNAATLALEQIKAAKLKGADDLLGR